MFLGGLPDPVSDTGRAWKNWFMYAKQYHPEYFKKLMVIAHPISSTYKLSEHWKTIFGSRVLFYALTNENEHLKTAWATRSLVDVTILMIRKSYELSNTVQKFILLDGTTCPLYNLKVIYDTVTSNRLNWLDSPLLYSNCKSIRENWNRRDLPALQCSSGHPSDCFQEKDCSFWSQWCILDVKYFRDLLKANIVKDQILISCPTADINQITVQKSGKMKSADKKIAATLGAFVDSFDKKPCVISDEMYFGMFLKRTRTISEFLDIVFTVNVSKLLIKYDEIKHVKLKYVRQINPMDTNGSGSGSGSSAYDNVRHHNIWLMDSLLFAQNVNNVSIHSNDAPYYRSSGDANEKKLQLSLQKYPFFINPFRINDRIVRPSTYTIPSTYTDWRYANPDPLNVFRSFQYNGLTISDLIERDPKALVTWLKSSNGYDQSFASLKMDVIPYWSHPMQYNTRSLKLFVNAYNIMEYFSKMGSDSRLQELRDTYKNILKTYMTKKEISFYDSSSRQTVLIIFEITVNNKFEFAALKKGTAEPIVGCPVTKDALNQARMRGALFLRKCENGSYIHAFSKQLFTTPTYLYKSLLMRQR